MSYTFEGIASKARDKGETSTAAHIEEGGANGRARCVFGKVGEESGALDGREGAAPCEVGPRENCC